jgi:hypothetical protein
MNYKKITKVTESVPKETTLPTGVYLGMWGGHVIEVEYQGRKIHLHTEEGVKGMDVKVIVNVVGDEYKFVEANN